MKTYEVCIERTIKTVHTVAQKADDEADAQCLAKEKIDEDDIDPDYNADGFRIIDEDIKVREIGGGK